MESVSIGNESFISKYKIKFIIISGITACFLLNFLTNENVIKVALIFRIYYIILSISLFILLKQIRRFNKKNISKIIWIFFSLVILISLLGLSLNLKQNNYLFIHIKYLGLNSEIIFLLELFTGYALYRNYLNKGKLHYNFKLNSYKNSQYSIYFITLIIIIDWCLFYMAKKYNLGILMETINLIVFQIIWYTILVDTVLKPYSELSKSLSNENKELDYLNKKINIKNKQLEKSILLLKNKQYLNLTFFRFMPHPFVILNSANDRILFVNKEFLKLIEVYDLRRVINKKINKYVEFLPKNKKNKNYNSILNIGHKKKFIYTKPLAQYSNESSKVILIRDNTLNVEREEIRKEVKRKKIEENLRREFLSSISHDLKTPINVIYSVSQVEKIYLIQENLQMLEKYNGICKQNCISLIKLTNNLIDNSRITSQYLTPRLNKSNIVEVVEDMVMSLVEYAKWNNINLIFDTNTEECYLNIDKEFMERIILNLVSNSVKYAKDSGEIYVTIEESDVVEISIKDNGIGMSDDFINKAFNRYSIEKNGTESLKGRSGIGLFVVKELVELQGGIIFIKSKLNIGTNIVMQFKRESENGEQIVCINE